MHIAKRLRAGSLSATDETDWDALYRELLPKVYRYFAYRIGSRQSAEDLTATTFERAWKRRRRYRRDTAAFSAWLFGIARNVAREHFRRSRPEIDLDESRPSSPEQQPEQRLLTQQYFDALAQLLTKLPERERELIALKYGAEMSNRAIAKVSGLSESNVGTILHRTVASLRHQMEQDDE